MSATKLRISTSAAPAAIGPYSQAIRQENLLFTSGQIPLDPATGDLVEGGIREQAARVLQNLQAVLEAAGLELIHVVKTTIFLKDMKDFPVVNDVYSDFFDTPDSAFPARSTVQVAALPKNSLIEIECIAKYPAD